MKSKALFPSLLSVVCFLLATWAGTASAEPGSPVDEASAADTPGSEAKNKGLREVVVERERLRLCDVVPDAPREICDTDLGAAPPPGQRIRLSGRNIRMRFARGFLSELGVVLPEAIIVARKSQILQEHELRKRVEEVVALQLPEGLNLLRARVLGGVELPVGDVMVDVALPRGLRVGQRPIWVTVMAGGVIKRVPATLEIGTTIQEEPDAVRRGDRVSILLKIRSLSIQSEGVAQSSGSEGEMVAVLPKDGRKVVRARVLRPGHVEVIQ